MVLKIITGNSGVKSYLRRCCLIFIILTFIAIQIKAQNGWTRKKNTLHSRIGCYAVAVNDKIYVMGGFDGSFKSLNFNEVYDPLTDTWEAKKPMQTRGGIVSLAAVDGIIYVLGGGMPSSPISDVYAYDPVSDTWNNKANLPYSRFAAAAGVLNGIIYNVAGNHTERYGEAYDPAIDTWTSIADIPETYGGVMVASFGGLLYAFGGGYHTTFSTTFAYNPGTNTWTKKTNMPTAREWPQTAPVVDGKIYIIGGNKAVYGEILSDIEMYDPSDDSWSKLPDAPFNRTFYGVAAVNDKIYIIGGTPDWKTGGNEVWEFTPPSIFTKCPFVDKAYAKINTDSVLFRTRFLNTKNIEFISNLIYTNSNGSQVDSVSLYDDGMHGDSLANNGLYGAYVPPQTNEDFYTLCVSMIEKQSQNYRIINDECKFTTAGPVKLDSLSFTKGIITYRIKPYVHNWGNTKTISNASIKLISNDPWVILPKQSTPIPDIPAGTTVGANSWITFQVIDSLFLGYFNFKAEIMVDGLTYWVDSTKMIVTGVEDEVRQPLTFKLEQNYPNPFNPSTTIKYTIPKQSNVTLKVFDVLGSEVATLVNKEQPQGNYEVEFDATDFTSGIYFYRLQAGDFTEARKMILIK